MGELVTLQKQEEGKNRWEKFVGNVNSICWRKLCAVENILIDCTGEISCYYLRARFFTLTQTKNGVVICESGMPQVANEILRRDH